MKSFKKTMRLFGFSLLIVLASFGVGISGGAPTLPKNKRDDSNETKTELVEIKDNKTKLNLIEEVKQ